MAGEKDRSLKNGAKVFVIDALEDKVFILRQI
jgi:hypothetical protein